MNRRKFILSGHYGNPKVKLDDSANSQQDSQEKSSFGKNALDHKLAETGVVSELDFRPADAISLNYNSEHPRIVWFKKKWGENYMENYLR